MTGHTPPIGTTLHRTYGLRLLAEPRVQRAALVVVLALVLLFRLAQFATYSTQIQWGYDFSAYWQAGERVLSGASPYSPDQLAGTYSPQQQFLYLYPPPLAVAMTPLAALFDDYRAAAWVWSFLGALAAIAVVLAVARSEGLGRTRFDRLALVGAAFAFPPVVGELVMGNVHLLLLALLAAAWLGVRRAQDGDARGELVAGVAVGVASIVKVFPALLVLWFLLTGRRRAAAWSIVAAGLIALATLPVVGLQPWLDYPRVLANLGAPVDVRDTLAPTVWLEPILGFGLARAVVTAVALAALAWSARTQPAALSFGVAVLLSVLVAPAVYQHYLALAVLPMLLALAHAGLRPWLAVGYLAMFGGEQAALGDAVWVVNRLLPTLGVLVLVAGMLLALRRRPGAAPGTSL